MFLLGYKRELELSVLLLGQFLGEIVYFLEQVLLRLDLLVHLDQVGLGALLTDPTPCVPFQFGDATHQGGPFLLQSHDLCSALLDAYVLLGLRHDQFLGQGLDGLFALGFLLADLLAELLDEHVVLFLLLGQSVAETLVLALEAFELLVEVAGLERVRGGVLFLERLGQLLDLEVLGLYLGEQGLVTLGHGEDALLQRGVHQETFLQTLPLFSFSLVETEHALLETLVHHTQALHHLPIHLADQFLFQFRQFVLILPPHLLQFPLQRTLFRRVLLFQHPHLLLQPLNLILLFHDLVRLDSLHRRLFLDLLLQGFYFCPRPVCLL